MRTQVCISLTSRLTEMPTTIDVLLCLSKWPRELVLPIIEKKSEVKVVNIQNNKTTKQQIIKYVFKTKFQKDCEQQFNAMRNDLDRHKTVQRGT